MNLFIGHIQNLVNLVLGILVIKLTDNFITLLTLESGVLLVVIGGVPVLERCLMIPLKCKVPPSVHYNT